MPREHDRHPLRVDRDPLRQLVPGAPNLPKLNPIDWGEFLLNEFVKIMEDIPIIGPVVKVLKQLLDTDGDGNIELEDLIGLFTGRALIDAIMNGLGFFGSGFSLGALGEAFTNLPMWVYNAIKGLITSVFDLGLLRITPNMIFGGTSDNMLLASDFKAAESMTQGDGWTWDGTVGRTAPGSAKATANGQRMVQLSNLVRVEAGQKLNVSGWVKWAGLTAAAGAAFKVEAQFYSGTTSGATLAVASTSSPAGSGGWVQLTGPVTVPSGVDGMRVRISVEATVTAGSVWWDDVECTRTGTMPQDFITNLIPDIAGVRGFIQQVIDTIMNGFGQFGSGFSLSHLLTQLGNIPQTAISGLSGALGSLLPKGLFDQFLGGLAGSAGTGSGGGTGIPLFDGALDAIGGLFGKAQNAQNTAQAAKQGINDVRATSVTSVAVPGGTVTRVSVSGLGTTNVTLPPADSGKVITKIVVQCFGPGQGGSRGQSASGQAQDTPGGDHGGVVLQEFLPSQLPNTLQVFNGTGGAGQSGTGYGAYGQPTTVKSTDGGTTYVSTIPGIAVSYTLTGVFQNGAAAGNGGAGGGYISDSSYDGTRSSTSYAYFNGKRGDPSPAGLGGEAGYCPTGWFGSGASNPVAGVNAPTNDPLKQVGGSGGGGGYAKASGIGATQSGGAPGGYPGGGGGGAGAFNGGFGATSQPGGQGGNGRTDFWIYQQEVTA